MSSTSMFKQATGLSFFLALVLSACAPKNQENQEASSPTPSATPAAPAQLMAAPPSADATAPTPSPLPPVTNQKAELLQAMSYHGDEVRPDAQRLTWFGLFNGPNGWYLQQTVIKTTRVYDPIVDDEEDGKKTGIEVTVSNKDTSLLLISGLDYLRDRQVPAFNLGRREINPGEEVRFTYKGNAYRLWATGKKTKENPEYNGFLISDYKLYLSTVQKGQEVKQLLVEVPTFDDTMVQILFAGDIDGDGLPDFVLDRAAHYNVSEVTLFLSAPAKKGQLVKVVGAHSSVGC